MHADQTWSSQRHDRDAYGLDDDGGGGDFGGGDFGGYDDGDPTAAGRRYLTVQPKQWCTSYVSANRHRYIHSTESTINHNGNVGLDNDVFGRTTADFFRSKTVPRRPATGMAVMDDYASCGNDRGDGDDDRDRAQWHDHPSSADIVEYDSSVAADALSAQQQQHQQQTQFLLPRHNQQQQQQQRQQRPRVDRPYQRPANDVNCAGAKTTTVAGPKSKTTWKTGALYVFLACLLAVVVVNLSLTLWFIRVTRFTSEGMGSMKFTHGGLRLSGRTLVTDRLVASAIRSRLGQPIRVESTANITLTARNSQGRLVNSLRLTKDGLECAQANVFRVTDTRGETLFSADRSKVIVGAHELRVTGSGGAVFQGSVQTPVVRADSRHDLRLESASRRLELSGPQGVTIESRAGDITVSCLMDVKLESIAGAIQIDAAKVFFKGLKTVGSSASASPPSSSSSSSSSSSAGKRGVDDKLPSVYQLCVCGNGKVFMSPPDGQCAADNESLVCR